MNQTATFPLSFEFFPPKTAEGAQKLVQVRQALYPLAPEFFSVTYGAGGTTRSGTLQQVGEIMREGWEAAPHFSCIGATRASVCEQLDEFRALGIRRIVALRGDLPSGYGGSGEFRYASDLVAFIRQHSGDYFHLVVACYPETHPQARSVTADLHAFVAKVQAGANSAVTQYFFNIEAYLRFVEETQRLGVFIPIIPGVMPITNSSQLIRFSDACGAEVPRWIRMRLLDFADDTASIRAFGLEVVMQLCQQLRAAGAPGLHFYTMNQAHPVLEICRQLS